MREPTNGNYGWIIAVCLVTVLAVVLLMPAPHRDRRLHDVAAHGSHTGVSHAQRRTVHEAEENTEDILTRLVRYFGYGSLPSLRERG